MKMVMGTDAPNVAEGCFSKSTNSLFLAKEHSRPDGYDAVDAKQREELESEEKQKRHKKMVDEIEEELIQHLHAHAFHESEQQEDLDKWSRTLTELRCKIFKNF